MRLDDQREAERAWRSAQQLIARVFEAAGIVDEPMPFAVRDMLPSELAPPYDPITALSVRRDRIPAPMASLVGRVAGHMLVGSAKPLDLRDDSRLLARDCRLGDAVAF